MTVETPTKLMLLVAAHLLVLPLATFAAYGRSWPHPAGIVHVSIIFADGGLLAFWAGLGGARRWVRATITGIGLVCLVLAAVAAENRRVDSDELAALAAVITSPTGVIFVALNRLRRGRRALSLTQSWALPGRLEGLKFTIKHLLIVTAVVAVVLSCGKQVQSWHRHSGTWIEIAVVTVVVAPCMVLIELAAFWASLGISHPLPRLLVLVPVAFVVGLVPPFYLLSMMGMKYFLGWSCITGGQALVTIATLLVVRSNGWRLSRAVIGADRPEGDNSVDVACYSQESGSCGDLW